MLNKLTKTFSLRYYRIIVSIDLLGDLILTKVWGGMGRSSGRITHLPCSTVDEAYTRIEKITKTRQQRGYILIIDTRMSDTCQ
jgi:hypothetical protein